ncbi:putative glucan 1,3-beta-glucosidase A [Penicillium rolfsii]|nr:putative glucan 1,3-beta-glucosidase A [Penicillium rolfsii]
MPTAASSIGAAAGAAIRSSLVPEDSCSNSIFTGEILHLSLNIIEYPVIVDVELEENAVVTIDNTILIECTNAPTHLHTTVYATETTTVTKTISTATITAQQVAATSDEATHTVMAQVGSKETSASDASTRTVLTEVSTKGQSQPTDAIAPVAGGSAVGSGVNTALYTASTSNTVIRTVTKTTVHHGTTATKTYTVTAASTTATVAAGEWTDWTKFKANGVNLGGWLELEKVFNQYWWDQYAPDADDEWNFCKSLGARCASVMEHHYASYITTQDIDKLAKTGVNILRIPTTYAAWIKVPGSELYHGNQQEYLKKITVYAIEKYNMRVIVGLHSLPGGVNSLDIGEAIGHDSWFFNSTNLAYSLQAVDEVLSFFVKTGYPWAFTLAPINEASDNPTKFASPETMTTNGTAWVVRYVRGALSRIARVDKRIPLMLQDCFLGEEHWSPYFANGTNLVIDTHVYYFAASGVYSQWASGAICGQASVLGGDGKFPVFVGEWALQTLYSNTYANRKSLFNTQRFAWSYYVQGGTFWNVKHNSSAVVDGQGTQRDYWSYERLIDAGVITRAASNETYC